MQIVVIKDDNKYILETFMESSYPKEFRYFNNRNIDCIKNHELTVVGLVHDEPIAYGHIDKERDINWLGLCILKVHHGKSYGKQILSYLLDYIDNNNHIDNIQLSVDTDNYKAFNLYLNHNFTISTISRKNYIMKYQNSIELPVSMGEALDKLTILDIKMKKINDERRRDVKKEFDILNEQLQKYKKQYIFYYNILLSTNESIWNMQDKFRDSNNQQEQNKLCIKIIKENDNRFRIKNKINIMNNSYLKEQKGYKQKTAFVLTHLGLGDNITAIGAVRYLSTCYDKVYVVCKEKNRKNIELLYADDESIKIYPVGDDKNISPRCGFNFERFKQITQGMDLYLAGEHVLSKPYNPMIDLPFNFYRDMNINENYFKQYFHINIHEQAQKLFDELKSIDKYIFIHNSASTGDAFNIGEMEEKLNFNKHNTLVINPCQNVYNQGDKFFPLAQKFLNHPLAFYILIIINASKIIITDSSFFSLILNLPIKTKDVYLKSRDGRDYKYLSDNYNYNFKII